MKILLLGGKKTKSGQQKCGQCKYHSTKSVKSLERRS